ncbi:hypothetical protein [Conexibacter sp. DBS9H8]|uniref:hypothetical protein n=1 Tax=Conexibacter sp. DBS9H8 TaxID=2937801 RepID=UPI00200C1745|nr:hypothetical protein [Conexibacter sp. DBS9H8]
MRSDGGAAEARPWGYFRGEPKNSIYVADALYDDLRRHGLPVSQRAQRAFVDALAAELTAG